MTDLQLGDLSAGSSGTAEAAADAAQEAAGDGKGTGEWAMEIFDRLDDRGLLEPMLFGPDSNISKQEPSDQGGDGEQGGGVDLDADAIADVGKTVIDTMGDVRISEVVKFAENNPEQVNQLIEQKMGAENGN